ncbi:MAG TPA: TraB/GumN family protein [Sphingomicrobium sp.]
MRASPPAWVATRADTKLVLVGTIHVLPARTQWRTERLDEAIASADTLIVDTQVSSTDTVTRAFAKRAFAANLPPIRDRVSPESRPVLEAALQRLKTPRAAFDRMKTWAAAFLLFGSRGGRCESGMSLKLETEFGRAERTVIPLQTPDESLADFDGLPESAQETLLAQALDPPPDDHYRAMITSWAAGDLAGSAAAARSDMGSAPAIHAMLARMTARLSSALLRAGTQPGTKLVVLGALHFDGPDSVLTQLQRNGYKVRRIQ